MLVRMEVQCTPGNTPCYIDRGESIQGIRQNGLPATIVYADWISWETCLKITLLP